MSAPFGPARVHEIAEAARRTPDDSRASFLESATGGDQALCQAVESVLRGEGVEPARLEAVQTAPTSIGQVQEEDDGPLPEHIGGYRVIRLIGVGGMGSVYEAEQASPRRRVALKVMRRGSESRLLARRFELEGQIQARLSHPGIATVYETGIAKEAGRSIPYFAMELVVGLPLVEFAKRGGLGLRERLALMADVCDAVSYAHQRGVIHRDLKPDNILVQESPKGPRPKILDFGIAKLTEHDLLPATMQTEPGRLIGTLQYMSPEQWGGQIDEIDTRTDVYALGSVLFHLLAEEPCYDIRNLPFAQALRRISETEPRLLGEVKPQLKGDVETIVRKSMEREKLRRYASVSELADDIRRFINDEPIAARPATVLYQLSRLARRHRALMLASGVVLATLVVAVIATTLLWISARRDRDLAEQKTEVAEGVSQVLLNALTLATPKGSPGREPLLMDAVDRVESQVLDPGADVTPAVQAVVLNIVGIIHRERGNYAHAEQNFSRALDIRRRVLAPDDPNLADSLNNMGLLRKRQERFVEAAEYFKEAVAVQRRSAFVDQPRLARNIYNLASTLIAAGEIAEGKPLLQESLDLHRSLPGDRAEVIGLHISAQARIATAEGRTADAVALGEEALAIQRGAVGPRHPSIVAALSDLADLAAHAGDRARAISLLQEADEMAKAVFTDSSAHPTARRIRERLLAMLRAAGRGDEAKQYEAP